MKALQYLFLSGFIGILMTDSSGCGENFIPDPADSRLPAYTENGNQVAGAIINGMAWKTHWAWGDMGLQRSFYFTDYPSGDSVTLSLDGIMTDGPYRNSILTLIVSIKNLHIINLEAVKILNGRTFILDGKNSYAGTGKVFYPDTSGLYGCTGGTGILSFKSVRENKRETNTRKNGDKYHPLIVAGVFHFNFKDSGVNVDSGRFDFQINDLYIDQEE